MPGRPQGHRLVTISFALASALLPGVAAGGSPTATDVRWSDTVRDVYVDGELETGAVVLSASAEGATSRLAILSERLGTALVVDLESLAVAEQALADFLPAGGGATSAADAPAVAVGRATKVRDGRSTHYLVLAGGHTLLISPHQGVSGPMAREELFAVVPTWRRRMEAYQPDPGAVTALAVHDRDARVTVALGTWCGDSRRYVPELLRALADADNPRLRLELVSIRRGFQEPAELIREQRLTNVPTVIVREDGEEIGRIVETPAGTSVEADLAAILGRVPPVHHGRWDREAELASGRYVYRDRDQRPVARERWQLFGTAGGGRLLHSVVAGADGGELEIWHRRDAEGASEFVEMTRRDGAELARTRVWIEGGELRSMTRGNVTGIVEQTLAVPPGIGVLLPCAAEAGFDWLRRGKPETESVATAFLLSPEQPAAGKLVEVRMRPAGAETLETPVGELEAARLEADAQGRRSQWWVDGTDGVAIRGRAANLGEVTIEALTVAGDPRARAAGK